MWVKYSRAPLLLLRADLYISFVRAICVQEVQALPMYPSEPFLRPGSCQWSRNLPSYWCILLVLLSHPSRKFQKLPHCGWHVLTVMHGFWGLKISLFLWKITLVFFHVYYFGGLIFWLSLLLTKALYPAAWLHSVCCHMFLSGRKPSSEQNKSQVLWSVGAWCYFQKSHTLSCWPSPAACLEADF